MTTHRPTLFLLHALGGSARSWDAVVAELGDDFDCIAIDLPGFGDAAPMSGLAGCSVTDSADHVTRIVARAARPRWLLVGHSMGGKIASIVAARALAGEPGLFGLAGVVLLAGSPPSPEPMPEEQRSKMIGWAADGPLNDAQARSFIDDNVASPLPAALDTAALADLRRSSREAWLAWLERGSLEDWSDVVGTLDVPALVMAGADDGDLGAPGQRATNLRVYPRARLLVQDGAAHLLPLESAPAVARAIRRFWQDDAGRGPEVPAGFAELIASNRVGRRARSALARRALADSTHVEPSALTAPQMATLRAVAMRVVPQDGPMIDLAARLDAQLAGGTGDGWRFDGMPADADAYASALNALEAFPGWPDAQQDATLAAIAAGEFDASPMLTSQQMSHWFEDARADLIRIWLAHPATMASIGFDGFANGGDAPRKQGFSRLGAGEREAWEPLLQSPRRADLAEAAR